MKYFKRQLQRQFLTSNAAAAAAADRQWMTNVETYFKEFEKLRPRLSVNALRFFKAHLHDGRLLRFGYCEPEHVRKTEVFELEVLEGWNPHHEGKNDDGKWIVRYIGVRRVRADFQKWKSAPMERPAGFDMWLYHELTDAGNGFLRHEIDFSSSAKLVIEFQKLRAERIAGAKAQIASRQGVRK